MMEDEDLYRFLDDCVADLVRRGEARGVPVTYTRLADGRDVWQVFRDEKFIGNSRVDPCSKILKRRLIRRHLEQRYDPEDTRCYIGIDWSEDHRFQKAKGYWAPYAVLAPLCDPPYVDKEDVLQALRDLGIEPPRLYAMGFPHNNCGGFCIKAGHGAFALLLDKMPERYAFHEAQERAFRDEVPGRAAATVLKDRSLAAILAHEGLTEVDVYRDGKTWRRRDGVPLPKAVPLTLEALRVRIEGGGEVDHRDLGGCACFTPDEGELPT
jgi:hypothetical protein